VTQLPATPVARRLLLLFPAHSYRVDAYIAACAGGRAELTLGTDLPAAFARRGLPVLEVDFARPEASATTIVAAAAGAPFHGVIATNEASAVVAALVAKRLGLPHNDPEGVRAASDKRLMRERLAAVGVPGPRVQILEPDQGVADLDPPPRFPCVVKPPMLTGSQGVIRADDADALAAAVARTRRILERHPSALRDRPEFHRLLIEGYLEGPEVAVEALVEDGVLRILAVFDKPDELTGPFFEETLYVTPSRHPPRSLRDVVEVTARAAAALGLRHGPIHAELRIDPVRGPAVVEIAARSIGGLCSRVLTFVAGPLEDLVVAHALGEPRAEVPALDTGAPGAAGVMMLPIPRSGVLRGVHGVERAGEVPGIEGVTLSIQPGEAIHALPEGASYLGFIFARASTPAEVEVALRAAHAELSFDLAPLLPLL
jgi:biotin carboxylase